MTKKILSGKVAIVSGGSKGIGLAVAKRLAEDGADIFLAASNAGRLKAARETIEAATGQSAAFHAADLRTLEGCRESYQAAADRFGCCDILINAAGATKGGTFPEQPDEEMLDGFALKFHGAVRLSRLFWPQLKEASGCVINIVGGFARTPAADFMVGGAVNAALANFSKALAAQGLRDDVNVNWIHPGLTVTERLETIFADRAKQQDKTRDQIERESVAAEGLRRLGQPDDVSNLVAFLCSPAARHIHGAGIPIDGGGAKGYY
ncbi:SDR family oxidoreductase [Pelagibius sp. Alg239-R121]|uniref:SDR family oxidoreductase n=1 Tax=Pelagibius sp. Alg239-R121 TaxID=2993448 RepID=UPI0024A62CFF|nr:SDR family oxidoreductase [Pelagibius sp. Alg239-R121]